MRYSGPELTAGYAFTEHTADVGLSARGPTPASAFAQAARGMFALILGQDPGAWRAVGPERSFTVTVEADGWEALLVAWLTELLFHFDAERFVPREIEFQCCTPACCSAFLRGVDLTNPEDARGVAVKAVTYHQLAVEAGAEGTSLHVVFDI
jgi:SHS2 domain-containing protein